MAKRSQWMGGLLWAEDCIKNNDMQDAEFLINTYIDEAHAFGDYSDFDRGALACLDYYRRMYNVR